MRYRLLGSRTGLRVSELALGTGRLGTSAGHVADRASVRRVLAAFAEAGGNLIDTSSAYQAGLAEEMVGDFLIEASRDAFVLSSKYGRTALAEPAHAQVGTHRKALVAEVENSLKRLRTDRIDLYFAHFDDGLTPIEEIMRGLDDLVRAGKVVYIGLSNFSAWRAASAAMLADLRGWAPLVVLQLQYNLLEREIDREHLPLARSRGLGLMAWSPLAGGLLSGSKSSPFAAGHRSSGAEGVRRGNQTQATIETLAAIADELGVEPVSVAIAWVALHDFIPVIGPRDIDQLVANLGAVAVRLDAEHIVRLDEVSAPPLGYPYDLLREQWHRLGVEMPEAGEVL